MALYFQHSVAAPAASSLELLPESLSELLAELLALLLSGLLALLLLELALELLLLLDSREREGAGCGPGLGVALRRGLRERAAPESPEGPATEATDLGARSSGGASLM